MAIETLNPATGELLTKYEAYGQSKIESILKAAVGAQKSWASQNIDQRATALAPMANLLRARVDEYALLMTTEMGKPISQSIAEVLKCATCVDHYVENGARYLQEGAVPTSAQRSGFRYLPLGVILGVMPWNYPFWQLLRFAIPTLIAGNGVVLKHASNVPGSALALEQLMLDTGLPEGLFSTVLIEGSGVIPLIHDNRIAGVSLTGSEGVGRRIGSEAGQALKPAVLELGGSDPFIVLADADVSAAAKAAATARTLNNGQSCIAAKRFIVVESAHDEFISEFVSALSALKVGDPTDPSTQLGPMARADLRNELHEQVLQTIQTGAKIALGAKVESGPGAFYPATVLTGVTPGMTGFDEELFGPAGVVVKASTTNDAISLANSSRYGLGSSIWTADVEQGLHLGAQLETGMVFVNDFVRSDPALPFGGVKASGYGREMGSHGILEFVNTQTIWVA